MNDNENTGFLVAKIKEFTSIDPNPNPPIPKTYMSGRAYAEPSFLRRAELAFGEDFRETFFPERLNDVPNFTGAVPFFGRWSGFMCMHANCVSRTETDPLIIYGVAAAIVKKNALRDRAYNAASERHI